MSLNFNPTTKPRYNAAHRAARYIAAAKSRQEKAISVSIWAHFVRAAIRG